MSSDKIMPFNMFCIEVWSEIIIYSYFSLITSKYSPINTFDTIFTFENKYKR